jgi:hypothetical protein
VLQRDGGPSGTMIDGFGDLTMITKYAFVNDGRTGDVLSGGLCVTAPTGRDVILANGQHLNSVLLQPWGGFIYSVDRLYALGFTSLIIPTAAQDVTFLAADVGVGYRLYQNCDQDRILTHLIPTIEFHANIPLNHNGTDSTGLIVMPDQFILTGGVHIGLCNSAFLTVAIATPLSGPRPYNYEVLTQLNFRF